MYYHKSNIVYITHKIKWSTYITCDALSTLSLNGKKASDDRATPFNSAIHVFRCSGVRKGGAVSYMPFHVSSSMSFPAHRQYNNNIQLEENVSVIILNNTYKLIKPITHWDQTGITLYTKHSLHKHKASHILYYLLFSPKAYTVPYYII